MQDDDESKARPLRNDDPMLPVERPLAEVLGIEVRFGSDDLAPPVDLDRIRQFLEHKLSPSEAEEVCHMIGSFRRWYEACTGLLRSRLKQA